MDGEFNVDAALAEIESGGSSEIPLRETSNVQENATPEEFEFSWNGKPIKAGRDKVLQWASQGYDYAQRTNAFKAEQEKFAQERAQYDETFRRYNDVDKFAKENPQWWEHVEKSWAERDALAKQNVAADDDPIAQKLSHFEKTLGELQKFREDFAAEKKMQEQQQQDKRLTEEIETMQKNYADLDWVSADESGLTLEMRVLQHAQQNGITSFRAAFRDLMHDQLLSLASTRQREDAVKNVQAQKKNGVLGTSATPKKSLTPAQNYKTKSYNDLLWEGMEELGLN